jgi:asparagine synthase (glutamine-hydrolysing)
MRGFWGAADLTGALVIPEAVLGMTPPPSRQPGERINVWRSPAAVLCSAGREQPLRSPAGDVCLVADVRLDNREELISKLACFLSERAPADSALILAAYLHWGLDCPRHLLGDFAFAVWDERQNHLFCARDPLGMKTLHFYRKGSLVCFATAAQQVLRHPAVPFRLDETTITDYLVDLWDDPERTFFLDVHRLRPGHLLVCTPAGDRLERTWQIDPNRQIFYKDDREYAEHFLDVFQKAVAARLRTSSGPVGIALSGGLDSSAVAAVARRVASGSPELFACSFSFDSLRFCDESHYIEATTDALSLEREVIAAERFWPLGDPEAYRPRLENPFLAWESSFHEMLSRARARGSRVLLTGNGGDDLLAGSPLVYADQLLSGNFGVLLDTCRYALSQGQSAWRILYRYFGQPLIPAAFDQGLRRFLRRTPGLEIPAWIRPEVVRRTGLADRLSYTPARHRRGAAWQELEDQVSRFYTWDRSVHWYDAQATPFGIEVRHPFLDRRIAELLLAIPPRQRSEPGVYKPLLRRAMQGLLPELIRQRKDKTSLGSFIDLGWRQKEADRIRDLLAEPLSAELGIVDGARLRAAFEFAQKNEAEAAHGLWYAVTLELWLREIASSGFDLAGVPANLGFNQLETVA